MARISKLYACWPGLMQHIEHYCILRLASWCNTCNKQKAKLASIQLHYRYLICGMDIQVQLALLIMQMLLSNLACTGTLS